MINATINTSDNNLNNISAPKINNSLNNKSEQPLSSKISSVNNNDTTKPKKKFNIKMIVGIVILLLIILGSGAGFYLSQQTQDLRQQAYLGQICTSDSDCDQSSGPEVCSAGICTADVAPETCAECSGSCGATGCSVDCGPNLNPRDNCGIWQASFVCEGRSNSGCNDANGSTTLPNPLDYSSNPETWCKTYQFDSNAPDGSYSVVYVGDNGETCVTRGGQANTCNPDDLDWDCDDAPIICNSDCSSDTECSDALGSLYSCVSSKCRLTSNSGSDSCTPIVDEPICNDSCRTDEECPDHLACYFNNSRTGNCRLPAPNEDSVECVEASDPLSCDNITGTLTNGTANGIDTLLNYEVTSTGAVQQIYMSIKTDILGAWDTGILRGTINNPPNGVFSSNITFNEMITSLLASRQHTREEIIEAGILYEARVVGPMGFCMDNGDGTGHWSGANSPCDPNPLCRGEINLVPDDEPICNDLCRTDSECPTDLFCYFDEARTGNCRLPAPNEESEQCIPIDETPPMCVDVAIFDTNDIEINPEISTFAIGDVIKFRCAAEDDDNLITHYEFEITEPQTDGTDVIITGDVINPVGSSAMSLEYTIENYLTHQVRCRACTDDGCQEYITIGN